ncbi:GGDEF domain-containing protein [Sphingomonas sp. HITSZ_GF]|uniref:GGDEF domain-containing protein n=1 Tax=Sphingomonas sp. HITSZ_GF TaxID=3037247 RepID=UPI00240DA5F4|nr:GGDEF domain-containing protein [Sphingomonas sp. HITSZ_GF]MDG2534866.1 GGDEF domain-containing protein [Sphingomonas sp. HITSZ_GF]
MNAPVSLHSQLDRLTAWFRRSDDTVPDRSALHRLRYEQIGSFLFEHGLEPSTTNFDFAGRFLEGRESALVGAAEALLATKGRLTDRDVERIVERCAPTDTSDKLEKLTRLLEAKVAECLGAVGDASASTSAYSTALGEAAGQLESEPGEAYRRLLEVTLEVAETTRRIGGRLESTREDTKRLRADLDRAVRAAEEDHLTGLPNRRGFFARMEETLARPNAAPFALALCDIDNFKAINDRHGHHTGDRVLRFVGRTLREFLGRRVMVARYGGEEFVCLFEGSDAEDAAESLDACRTQLRDRLLRDQTTNLPIGRISFSAGVTTVAGDAGEALRIADELLYAAKHAGKDQVVTSVPPVASAA